MNEEQNINNRRDDLPAGAETDGGALSVWARTGEIVLWKRFDRFADYPAFEAAINAFLAQIIHWKTRLDALPSVAAADPSPFLPGGLMV